ncbi:MAG: ROK family protein [Maricaulaceae bacterium]|nr:ROK family protein [Maricaulaceae bacterium]
MIRIGVDLGGTKIEAAALAPGGAILARLRVATPQNYAGCIVAVRDLVQALEAEHGSGRAGVGHPGSLSPATGLTRNANSTWLNGKPLKQDLEVALCRPVRLANDADCFALSEAVDGAGAGANIVFGVILGTGVGGGIVIKGELLNGAQGIAGEWGHNPLPWADADERPGPQCWCGKQGCIETWLSGPGLTADHACVTGEALDAKAIFAAAAGGNGGAQASAARYTDRLARGLATVLNVIDADIVVLGGGVSNTPGLAEAAETGLSRYIFSDVVRTRVVRAMHGDSSGVRGAAWLWPAETGG